jgi:predicted Zn-dependent protease
LTRKNRTMAKIAAPHSRLISPPLRTRLRAALLLSGSLLFLSACQTLGVDVYEPNVAPSATPQTAEKAGASDPRTRIGANEHPRIIASYGGEFRDAKTERLVARIVGALTLVSENPSQAYRITVLNSPAVNAFALPGGYLYVTRGLLALANDASEVAAVLSHEMAHVTANHGLERQRREQEVELAGQVAEETVRQFNRRPARGRPRQTLARSLFEKPGTAGRRHRGQDARRSRIRPLCGGTVS